MGEKFLEGFSSLNSVSGSQIHEFVKSRLTENVMVKHREEWPIEKSFVFKDCKTYNLGSNSGATMVSVFILVVEDTERDVFEREVILGVCFVQIAFKGCTLT